MHVSLAAQALGMPQVAVIPLIWRARPPLQRRLQEVAKSLPSAVIV